MGINVSVGVALMPRSKTAGGETGGGGGVLWPIKFQRKWGVKHNLEQYMEHHHLTALWGGHCSNFLTFIFVPFWLQITHYTCILVIDTKWIFKTPILQCTLIHKFLGFFLNNKYMPPSPLSKMPWDFFMCWFCMSNVQRILCGFFSDSTVFISC